MPVQKLKNNSIIYINLNNYEIGKNWFYESQNNIYRIYNNMLNISDENLLDENILINIIIKNNKSNKKKYHINRSKFKLSRLLKELNKIKVKNKLTSLSYTIQYDEKDILKYNYVLKEFITALKVISLNDDIEKISYMYDYLSVYMDNEFKKFNLCNFKNNQCVAQRDLNNKYKFPYKNVNGCCFDVRIKKECAFLNISSCEKCKIKSLSCKLLICGYLREKGINYSIYDTLLTKVFLTTNQKLESVWNFYTDKKEMMEKLNKNYIS